MICSRPAKQQTKMETVKRERKLAGFWTQTRVILFKNLLLYKRNKLGIVFELIFIAFSLIILLLAYYSFDKTFPSQNYPKKNQNSPIASLLPLGYYYNMRGSNVYYYPGNKFVEVLVKRAFTQLDGRVKFMPANQSSPENTTAQLESTIVFISFPDSYKSYKDVNEVFKYTIFTPE